MRVNNTTNDLAGGVPFGPVIRASNITPDAQGRPAGLTLEEFIQTLRTGADAGTCGGPGE